MPGLVGAINTDYSHYSFSPADIQQWKKEMPRLWEDPLGFEDFFFNFCLAHMTQPGQMYINCWALKLYNSFPMNIHLIS